MDNEEVVKKKLKAMPDQILKKIYENYVYQLIEELIPYNEYSNWYLVMMKKELEKRGWVVN